MYTIAENVFSWMNLMQKHLKYSNFKILQLYELYINYKNELISFDNKKIKQLQDIVHIYIFSTDRELHI